MRQKHEVHQGRISPEAFKVPKGGKSCAKRSKESSPGFGSRPGIRGQHLEDGVDVPVTCDRYKRTSMCRHFSSRRRNSEALWDFLMLFCSVDLP